VDPESNDRRFLAAALSRVLISRGNPSSLNPSFSWKGDQLYLNPGAAIHGILPLPENFTWTFTTNSPLDLSARQFHTTLSGSTVVRRKLMGETYPLVRIANPSPDRTAILTVSGQWTRTDRKKGNRIYMFFGRGIQESDLFSLTHIRSDYQLSWIEASVAEDAFGYIAEGSDLAPHTMPPLPILLLPAGFFPAVVPCPAMKTFSQKDEPSEYSPNLIQIDLGDLSSSFFDLPRISQTRFWMENNGPLFLTPEGALTLNVVVNPGENTFILQREDPTGFVDAFVVNRAEIQSAQVATLTLSDGWMESGTRKMLLRRGKITVISSEREAHTATICLRGVERIHPSRRESIRRERLNDLEQTLLTLKSKQTKADNLWIFLFLGEAETSRYLYMCRGPADTSDIGNLARTIATFLQMDERDLPPRFFPR